MENVRNINCISLTAIESQQVSGGANNPISGFWKDLAYIAGVTVHGFIVFGTEGGRNAGISVR